MKAHENMSNFLYGPGKLQEILKTGEEDAKVPPAPIKSQANPTNLHAGKEAFKNFTIYLSKFTLENNIQIGQKGKEIILSRIKQLDRTEEIPPEILQLVHNVAEHRSKPKYYKLNACKEDHCGECIRDFLFNKERCQHGKQTFEREKSDISVAITKLNDTYKTCPVCNKGQDDIDFSLTRSEGCCNVCDSCTRQHCINNLNDFYSLKCPRIGCENKYSVELRCTLKIALSTLDKPVDVPPPAGKEVRCIRCKRADDTKELCEKGCFVCGSCAKEMRDNNVEKCESCGSNASP